MKLFKKAKDGGPKSTVIGYWLIEWKRFFSIVLLKFEDGSRDEYHNHAFNSWNWILKGEVTEEFPHPSLNQTLRARFRPYYTARTRMHRVRSKGTTWVFSIRGPWSDCWTEYDPKTKQYHILTHGRKPVDL